MEKKFKCIGPYQPANAKSVLTSYIPDGCHRPGDDNDYDFVEEFQFPTVHGTLDKTLVRRSKDHKIVYGFGTGTGTGTGSLARSMRIRSCYAPGKPTQTQCTGYVFGTHPRMGRHGEREGLTTAEVPQYFILDPDALQSAGLVSHDCRVPECSQLEHSSDPEPDVVVCDRHATSEQGQHSCDTLKVECSGW